MSCLAKWSKGLLHATEVQEICFDAYQDQMNLLQKLHLSPEAVNKSLLKMAKLGSWGKHKGNILRELKDALGSPSGIPEAMTVPVQCVIAKPMAGKPAVQAVDVPFMPPHLLLHHIYRTNRARFDEFLADPMTQPFWRGSGSMWPRVVIQYVQYTQCPNGQAGPGRPSLFPYMEIQFLQST